jgi:Spy/CpxP family protein refolding chaperone
MKPFGITLGLILLAGNLSSFGQSVQEQQDAAELKTKLTQMSRVTADLAKLEAQLQTPFGLQFQSTKEPTAALQVGLPGMWWRDARWIQALDLTADQQKKMDDAFRQNRIKLIDLTATLEKAELMLEPLVENVRPGDEAKILAQIDDVANARAELEKANARMLLAIRQVLTQDQWNKLPKTKSTFSYFSTGKTYFKTPPATPFPPATPATK